MVRTQFVPCRQCSFVPTLPLLPLSGVTGCDREARELAKSFNLNLSAKNNRPKMGREGGSRGLAHWLGHREHGSRHRGKIRLSYV